MKTGDIILISGSSKRSKNIQKFQSINDPVSGKWNHTGLIWVLDSGVYVVEAELVQQRKFKAAVKITPFEAYQDCMYEYKIIQHDLDVPKEDIERIMLEYVGTPYDYFNLIFFQPVRLLFDKWIGGEKKRDKRMICHEFVMTVWNRLRGIFPECYKGDIFDIYYCKYFKH